MYHDAHKEAVCYQLRLARVHAGGDAVESVNQSCEADREAEAAADLQVFDGCSYDVRKEAPPPDPNSLPPLITLSHKKEPLIFFFLSLHRQAADTVMELCTSWPN